MKLFTSLAKRPGLKTNKIGDIETYDSTSMQSTEVDINPEHIAEVARRKEYYKKNPQDLISWKDVRSRLNFE